MKSKIKFLATYLLSLAFIACQGSSNHLHDDSEKMATKSSEEEPIYIASINSTGDISFVADQNLILSDWESYLSSHIPEFENCELTSVTIKHDEGTGSYFMNATGALLDEDFRSLIKLIEGEGGCFYLANFTLSCSTTDCASDKEGCLPAGTFCTECTNKGKCTKSITGLASTMFPSLEAGGGCN